MAGKHPQSIAGAAIYVVSQLSVEKKNFAEIAKAVGVTENTIRLAYKEIYAFRANILPTWWKYKESIDSLKCSY
jgi:transcription initiation factor TFIIIB Brf1 subunit/transcription initiation factor TFIIB